MYGFVAAILFAGIVHLIALTAGQVGYLCVLPQCKRISSAWLAEFWRKPLSELTMQTSSRAATPVSAWLNGFLGVLIFSASLPATRLAVQGFPPLFLTAARAMIAACLGLCLLLLFRQPWPRRRELPALVLVAFGVVLGFPLFTALALETISAAHSIVFIGLLPLSTAIFAVLRGAERPKPLFWLFSALGSLVVVVFAWWRDSQIHWLGDSYMLLAIIVCGLGYAEGAQLSRRLGGWQVISWALLIAAPLMALLTFWLWPPVLPLFSEPAWLGLAYVAVFSMLIGFVFWYRGLASGGIAKIGQLQLLQPFFGLILASLILHEALQASMLIASALIVVSVAFAKRYA